VHREPKGSRDRKGPSGTDVRDGANAAVARGELIDVIRSTCFGSAYRPCPPVRTLNDDAAIHSEVHHTGRRRGLILFGGRGALTSRHEGV
jgi:hypothetical protein